MGAIKVLAGDFSKSNWAGNSFSGGQFTLYPTDTKDGSPLGYHPKTDVKELTLANETTGVKVFGAAGWGALGALVAGPVGAIVGGLLGGRGKAVVFVAEFADGRRLLAETDGGTWTKILATRF